MWKCTGTECGADDLDWPIDGVTDAALGGEDVARVRIFLPQGRHHAKLIAANGMDGWLARGRQLVSLTGDEPFSLTEEEPFSALD